MRPVSGAGLRKLAAGQRNGARAVTFTRVNHTPSVKHMTLLPTREVYRLVPDLERHTANSARYISLSVAPKGPGARPFSFLSPLGNPPDGDSPLGCIISTAAVDCLSPPSSRWRLAVGWDKPAAVDRVSPPSSPLPLLSSNPGPCSRPFGFLRSTTLVMFTLFAVRPRLPRLLLFPPLPPPPPPRPADEDGAPSPGLLVRPCLVSATLPALAPLIPFSAASSTIRV